MRYLSMVLDRVMKFVEWFAIGILGIMTVALVFSVSSRYIFGFSIHWVDPLARYSQVWIMLLGSALALRKGLHIGVDNFINKFPEAIRNFVIRFDVALMLVFSSAMIYQGIRLIGIAEGQIIPEMGLPMKYVYYMIPASGVLLVLACVEKLLQAKVNSISTAEGEDSDD